MKTAALLLALVLVPGCGQALKAKAEEQAEPKAVQPGERVDHCIQVLQSGITTDTNADGALDYTSAACQTYWAAWWKHKKQTAPAIEWKKTGEAWSGIERAIAQMTKADPEGAARIMEKITLEVLRLHYLEGNYKDTREHREKFAAWHKTIRERYGAPGLKPEQTPPPLTPKL